MNHIIVYDLGTTSVKVSLFNQLLQCVSYSIEEYKLLTPDTVRVELDPTIYWNACICGTKHVIQKSNVDVRDIQAISISTQGETLIPIDKNGHPLSNAIVWFDVRASEQAKALSSKVDKQKYFRITGLPELNSANPICKLMWIKEHSPHIYENTYKFLLLEDYIIFKLTSEIVTEATNASSSGYFNTRENTIWHEGLNLAGIDADKIPTVVQSGTPVGYITAAAAAVMGLSTSTMVYAGANDQICSAVGSGNISPGIISETTGTSLVVASTASELPDTNPYTVTFSRHVDNLFLMLSYATTAGIIFKWFKENFCENEIRLCHEKKESVYAYLGQCADKISRGSNGLLLIPTFSGKLSPEIHENAKGVFFGVNVSHTKPHFIRSIFEGVGYMLQENLEIAYRLCGEPSLIYSCGGGAKSPVWCQIKSDISGKNIATIEDESSSVGAAIIGAVSEGWYTNIHQACNVGVKVVNHYAPNAAGMEIYKKLYDRYVYISKSVLPVFQYDSMNRYN